MKVVKGVQRVCHVSWPNHGKNVDSMISQSDKETTSKRNNIVLSEPSIIKSLNRFTSLSWILCMKNVMQMKLIIYQLYSC